MKKLVVALAVFFASAFVISDASAAVRLMSTASGNINATGTWSIIDTTGANAFLNSETVNTALTTSPVASSTFTPASETITEVGVRLAAITGTAPAGTITIKLANSTSAGNRECTNTVNVADLPQTNGVPTAATVDGGWIIVTCAAVPNGTDAYTVTVNTSIASGVSTVNLFSSATTNWDRLLVTNGTQANGPAAGDQFMVFGQLTGAGTHNAYAVTINTTALVNYGNVANTLVDPSIAVGQWGTLASGVTAATVYVSEVAGPVVVYNGGVFTLGTIATPVPTTSSMTYTLNSTVEGDTGINVRNGGTFNSAGSSGGRTVTKTLLTTTATVSVTTTLTVADSTGWLSGDSLVIAGTITTDGTDANSKWDAVTMNGNASGTSLPLSAAPTRGTHTATALSYTSSQTGVAYAMNMYAAVILLNRNVTIQGSGATTNGYLYFQNNAAGNIDWTSLSLISGTVAGKRGVEVDVGSLGSFSLTNSSFVNSHNTTLMLGPTNATFGGTAGSYLTVQHNVIYNSAMASSAAVNALNIGAASWNPYWKIDDLTIIRCGYTSFQNVPVVIGEPIGQFTNITINGSGTNNSPVLQISSPYSLKSVIGGQVGNVWGPITTYANTGWIMSILSSNGLSGNINGFYIWHEQGRLTPSNLGGDLVLDPFYIITSAFGLYFPSSGGGTFTVRNGVIGWDASTASNYPLTIDAVSQVGVTFDNMELCPVGSVGGVTWLVCAAGRPISIEHDIGGGGGYILSQTSVFLRNTSMLASLGTGYPTMAGEESYFGARAAIMQDCAACTPVKHAVWQLGGFLSYDSVISHTSGYSLRMTPKVWTFNGYISSGAGVSTAGTTLTITSGGPGVTTWLGDGLNSNGAGFIPGTFVTTGATNSFTVSLSQSVGTPGAPVQFQSYANLGSLVRLQSAPFGRGVKVAVASGVSNAQACVWLRPSINTDAAPTWGGSAVTYNGDQPRMIVRQNPYMGVQADTVLATASASAGTWGQLCATLPTAPADGEFEVVVDADQTFTSNVGGSVNIAEWSCVTCKTANGSQFWWNGVPAEFIVPPTSAGGGGGGGGGFGFGGMGN